MDKLIIQGGKPLKGKIKVSGAKNVAMKVILAGLLTDKTITIKNMPLISSVYGTAEIVGSLGVNVDIQSNHVVKIRGKSISSYTVPIELGGKLRTATMVIGPLLARYGRAVVPNPGGCRLGKRPIDRHIQGLEAMGAKVKYKDGFFYARTSSLHGVRYRFERNTHTGTETLILAAVLAKGKTILENAAQEPEIDDLINLLNLCGAQIKRMDERTIMINGVRSLHGAEYSIMSDRNEVVTFAVAAIVSKGDIIVEGVQEQYLKSFLYKLSKVGAGFEKLTDSKMRFYYKKNMKAVGVTTGTYPGFMTDWQAPWALLMTQVKGESTIHETIYEDRFGYVLELKKMGADIKYFNPKVKNPSRTYNFNWQDRFEGSFHAIKIKGPVKLHDAYLEVMDLRAGALLVLAASVANGRSVIHGIEHIDRGYEKIEERLSALGLRIERYKEQ